MKFSLAAQFLSPAFAAAVATSSSVSVAEELAKKYDNHRDIDGAAAAATSRASRNLDSTSKSSKSSSYDCPPEPTPDVECGNVYNSTATGEQVVVTLGGNLLCDGNVTEADGSRNAALTLSGEDAVLNCQGYTISQTTVNIDGIDTGSAAAVDCDIFPSDETERLATKQECGLFNVIGVRLENGARMVNCNIEKFYVGGRIDNGGKIENSGFSLNRRGVQIANFAPNTVSKIANSELYNNFNGLSVFQFNQDNAKVVIEDVTANSNQVTGMALVGEGITVENAYIKNNNLFGLAIGSDVENEITLAGDVSITNNVNGFAVVPAAQGTVRVTGNLISNRNVVGLLPLSDNFTIAVGGSYSGKAGKSGSGSLTACDNNLYVINAGTSTFEGSDYTCDTKAGTDLPVCKPCHPGCPSPEPDESSFQILSAAFEINELDFADHMDHGEIPV